MRLRDRGRVRCWRCIDRDPDRLGLIRRWNQKESIREREWHRDRIKWGRKGDGRLILGKESKIMLS